MLFLISLEFTMNVKIKLRYSSMLFAMSIGLSVGGHAFCKEGDYPKSINGVYDIKYDLAESKNRNLHISSASRIDAGLVGKDKSNYPQGYRASDNSEKENHYRKMRNSIKVMEIAYQTLNAVDAIQTISCMQKINCEEKNPLFGKHPSTGKIIAIKSLVGLLHYNAYRHGIKRDDRLKYTFIMEAVTNGVQGLVVGLNFKTSL
jgi:hypothetical protein